MTWLKMFAESLIEPEPSPWMAQSTEWPEGGKLSYEIFTGVLPQNWLPFVIDGCQHERACTGGAQGITVLNYRSQGDNSIKV